MAFHWLNCTSLSLAGLLPGEEKFFLLLASKVVTFFLLEMQRYVSSCGVCG